MATGVASNDFVPTDAVSRTGSTGPHQDLAYPLTCSAWWRCDDVSSGSSQYVLGIANGTGTHAIGMRINSSNLFQTWRGSGAGFFTHGFVQAVSSSTWYFCSWVFRGDTDREAYVNGASVSTNTDSNGTLSAGGFTSTNIGVFYSTNAPYNGRIAYVSINNADLGDNKLYDLMYNPYQNHRSPLWIQNLLVNSATAGDYKDRSGNEYDATSVTQPAVGSEAPPVYHWGSV